MKCIYLHVVVAASEHNFIGSYAVWGKRISSLHRPNNKCFIRGKI